MPNQLKILRVEIVINLTDFAGTARITGDLDRESAVKVRFNHTASGHVFIRNGIGGTLNTSDNIAYLKIVFHIKLTFS